MTNDELTIAARELAEVEGITPAAAADRIRRDEARSKPKEADQNE